MEEISLPHVEDMIPRLPLWQNAYRFLKFTPNVCVHGLLAYVVSQTMYVARHSWAGIAKQKQTPISVISDALGHDSEKTTLIYLSTLDTSAVDNANSGVLAVLGEW